MRLRIVYLLRNLSRNRLRAALTCAAVGLPIMILVVSAAAIDGIDRFLTNSARQLRLAVTHKATVVNPLPEGYGAKIRALDETRRRLLSVCAVLWIGGRIENSPAQLSTLCVDAAEFVDTFPEYELTPSQAEQWLRDKRSLIVGRSTAQVMGWKIGDRVTIRPSVPPYIPMEFTIISTAPTAPDPQTNMCRRDYWEDTIAGSGAIENYINFFFVKCATKEDLEHYRARIDELFAGASDETRTLDEKTFMNHFISQQFDLPKHLRILAAVTIFVAVMAAANTMGMTFRDRIAEYATLRAIGFGGGAIFGFVQTESMLLCAAGGVLGAATPFALFTFTPLREARVPLIESLEISPVICAVGVGIALLIGVVAALPPSLRALRLHVVSALRALE